MKESRIKALLKRHDEKETSEVLFHHRLATSTGLVRNACHPFSTKDYFKNQYIVVHNGVVRNTTELKAQHEARGIQYVSVQENGAFNDSEALTYDLARYFEGEVDEITAAGTVAFIAIKRNPQGKPVTLFFGRNSGNPLKMKKTDNSLTLSSEGEGEDVEVNMLHIWDYETKTLRKTSMVIPRSSYTYQGYNHGYTANRRESQLNYEQDEFFDRKYGQRSLYDDEEAYNDYWRRIAEENDAETGSDDLALVDADVQEVKEHFMEANQQLVKNAYGAVLLEIDKTKKEMSALESKEVYVANGSKSHEELQDEWLDKYAYSLVLEKAAKELWEDVGKAQEAAKSAVGFHP